MVINNQRVMDSKQTIRNKHLIRDAYAAFNNRDIDAALYLMQPDIHWPKAFEGGYVIGHQAVREYWTRQWSQIDPNVKPLSIVEGPGEKIEVEVAQLVKDLEGKILFDGIVKHIYVLKDGLLQQMDIG